MNRQIIPVGALDENCVVLWQDPAQAIIIDPGAEGDEIIAFCEGKSLTPACILLTHAHFDHIGAIPALLAKWPTLSVRLAAVEEAVFVSPLNAWPPEYERVPRPATLVTDLADGATFTVGGVSFTVLATPGHTPGSVCFHFPTEQLLVSGDTLFAGSCGRTDFPGGSPADMARSLKRLIQLPAETMVIPGHGMTTTIAREAASNPFVR